MAIEDEEKIYVRLLAVLRKAQKSSGKNKAAIGRAIGLSKSAGNRLSNIIGGTIDETLSVSRYAQVLQCLGIDLPALIERAIADDTEGLPDCVLAFLRDPRTPGAATQAEIEAIVALARAHAFDDKKEIDVVETWQGLKSCRPKSET